MARQLILVVELHLQQILDVDLSDVVYDEPEFVLRKISKEKEKQYGDEFRFKQMYELGMQYSAQ